jgi:hypothetical protein
MDKECFFCFFVFLNVAIRDYCSNKIKIKNKIFFFKVDRDISKNKTTIILIFNFFNFFLFKIILNSQENLL